ncbi:MAG: type II toxin-antitoxin system VapC family toxin [Sphingomonadales bacterium]|nr:type II toxin-antitoxin system VapC family toxin [Sphingomonadales bacterium]MBK9431642.1 type II toxin-antitoxin system VapC family toxin [Sphingomonadales bacterium]
MKFMLDANSVINLFSGHFPKLNERVGNEAAGDIVISTIAYAEVALGSENGKLPESELLAAFVAEIPVVDFDVAAAMAYSRLPFKRGNFDRLIAAHALSLGLTIISQNTRDFADVPGLKVENWTV